MFDILLTKIKMQSIINTDIEKNGGEKMTQEEHDLLVSIAKDVNVLKQDVGILKQDVGILKQDVGILKQDVGILKQDVGILKQDVSVLKQDVGDLKEDVQGLKVDVQNIKNYLVEKEQEFYDKISILFDARQINVEKIRENSNDIKSIKNILGKHAVRISKLESQTN